MVPPLPALPVPEMIRLPDAPVLLRMIALAGPLAAVPAVMLLNLRLAAPMVSATLRAVPVVVVSVLVAVHALHQDGLPIHQEAAATDFDFADAHVLRNHFQHRAVGVFHGE